MTSNDEEFSACGQCLNNMFSRSTSYCHPRRCWHGVSLWACSRHGLTYPHSQSAMSRVFRPGWPCAWRSRAGSGAKFLVCSRPHGSLLDKCLTRPRNISFSIHEDGSEKETQADDPDGGKPVTSGHDAASSLSSVVVALSTLHPRQGELDSTARWQARYQWGPLSYSTYLTVFVRCET